jgi:hypothetical protein
MLTDTFWLVTSIFTNFLKFPDKALDSPPRPVRWRCAVCGGWAPGCKCDS